MIGQIVKIEDDSYEGKDFKKVTLGDGTLLKVKQGREGSLKAKWGELIEGKTYEWTMGSYNDKPFVKDFKVTTEKPSAPTVQPSAKPDAMSKDEWRDKDRAQAFSIESQVAYKGIMEVASMNYEPMKGTPEYRAALDWAMSHLQPTAQKPAVEPAKSKSEPLKPAGGTLVFKDAGELKNYMKDGLKMNGMQISAATAGFDLATEKGRQECWATALSVTQSLDKGE